MAVKKNIIQTISEKEMDRKDFLKYSGLALLSIFGFNMIVNFLLHSRTNLSVLDKQGEGRHGFGSGKYGA